MKILTMAILLLEHFFISQFNIFDYDLLPMNVLLFNVNIILSMMSLDCDRFEGCLKYTLWNYKSLKVTIWKSPVFSNNGAPFWVQIFERNLKAGVVLTAVRSSQSYKYFCT